jgi:hypothetical protein
MKKSRHGQMELDTFPYEVGGCGKRNKLLPAAKAVCAMTGWIFSEFWYD